MCLLHHNEPTTMTSLSPQFSHNMTILHSHLLQIHHFVCTKFLSLHVTSIIVHGDEFSSMWCGMNAFIVDIL